MRIVWTRLGRKDVKANWEYLAARNLQAAEMTESAILKAVEKLVDFPHMGRPGRVEGTREIVLTRLPYIVIYAVRGTHVTILRVLHSAQQWPEGSGADDIPS